MRSIFSISHVRHLGYNELHLSLIKCHRSRSFIVSGWSISKKYSPLKSNFGKKHLYMGNSKSRNTLVKAEIHLENTEIHLKIVQRHSINTSFQI
jgi:hypothetical protein